MTQRPSFTIADRILERVADDLMDLDFADQVVITADIAALVEQYNPTITPLNVGQSIIDVLNRRGGFDAWWYACGEENQAEILTELDRLIVGCKVGADMNSYQERAHSTSRNTTVGGDLVVYPALGLCGEAGEVADKIKKIHRDKGGVISPDDLEDIKLELGDCIYYVAEIAWQLGLSLAEVAYANNKKLSDRAARNKIQGDGDNR